MINVLRAFRLVGLFPRKFCSMESATDAGPWKIGRVSYTYLILSITFFILKIVFSAIYLKIGIEDYKKSSLIMFISRTAWDIIYVSTDLISSVSLLKNHRKLAKSINAVLFLHNRFVFDLQNKHVNNIQNFIVWSSVILFSIHLCFSHIFSSLLFIPTLVFICSMSSAIVVNFLLTYYFYNVSVLIPKIIDYSCKMIHVQPNLKRQEENDISNKTRQRKLINGKSSQKEGTFEVRNTSIIHKIENIALNKSDEVLLVTERTFAAIENSMRLMMDAVHLFIMLQLASSTGTVTFGLYYQIKDPTLKTFLELNVFIIVAAIQIFFFVNMTGDVQREVSNNI